MRYIIAAAGLCSVKHGDLSAINAAFSSKLDLLNKAIADLDYSYIDLKSAQWGYDVQAAGNNNLKDLGDLSCENFPVAILPSGVCPMPA